MTMVDSSLRLYLFVLGPVEINQSHLLLVHEVPVCLSQINLNCFFNLHTGRLFIIIPFTQRPLRLEESRLKRQSQGGSADSRTPNTPSAQFWLWHIEVYMHNTDWVVTGKEASPRGQDMIFFFFLGWQCHVAWNHTMSSF